MERGRNRSIKEKGRRKGSTVTLTVPEKNESDDKMRRESVSIII